MTLGFRSFSTMPKYYQASQWTKPTVCRSYCIRESHWISCLKKRTHLHATTSNSQLAARNLVNLRSSSSMWPWSWKRLLLLVWKGNKLCPNTILHRQLPLLYKYDIYWREWNKKSICRQTEHEWGRYTEFRSAKQKQMHKFNISKKSGTVTTDFLEKIV